MQLASTAQNGPASTANRHIERTLFEHLDAKSDPGSPSIFILGAPRTGSTYFYQMCIHRWQLPYFDNFTNAALWDTPLVGIYYQWLKTDRAIRFESEYGKTQGIEQPSEGSNIVRWWFGGGHPSQLVSVNVLPGREEHLMQTVDGVFRLTGKGLLTKNPWNCFRVRYLATHLTGAVFLWIRRDIRAAAASDLLARYVVQGSPSIWNSATPAKVHQLMSLHPAEQVIENQYEFHVALHTSLNQFASGRFIPIWYEELVRDPDKVFASIERQFSALKATNRFAEGRDVVDAPIPKFSLPSDDVERLNEYLAERNDKFAACMYREEC